MTDYIIIGMVLHEELTGYDMKKEIDSTIGNFYKSSYGSLYPALKKLTEKGYLTMTEQMEGNKQKKYYKATNFGKAFFLDWLSEPINPKVSSDDHLVRIFFFDELSRDIREKRFQELEFYSQQMLQQLEGIEKELAEEIANNDNYYYRMSTLYFGLLSATTTIRFIKHIKEQRPFSKLVVK